VIHAWAPWVWGTTKSALYKYTYLYLLPLPLSYICCVFVFCIESNISATVPPIGMKVCTMVELCPGTSFFLLVAMSLGISKYGVKKGARVDHFYPLRYRFAVSQVRPHKAKYVAFFEHRQLWSVITFKRFKIEAYCLRGKCLWKELSKMYATGRYSPQGASQNTKFVAFGRFFVHSHFPHIPVLSMISSPTSPLSFSPRPSPFLRWTTILAVADRTLWVW